MRSSGTVWPRAVNRSRRALSKSSRGTIAAVAAIESTVEITSGRTQPGRRAIDANVGPGETKTPATLARGESSAAGIGAEGGAAVSTQFVAGGGGVGGSGRRIKLPGRTV